MKKATKVLAIALAIMLVAVQGIAACTVFAVGKGATVDGSTMATHSCDSTSDDLRVWLIPSMPEGTERDVVLDGRAGADYSNFPEVKDYGKNGMVLDTYTTTRDTNQYLHAMYSFMNEKGLAMGESTCSYDRNSEQGKKVRAAFDGKEGIYDCYMLQDIALENCDTAREAVEFMGALVTEYGWNGSAECIDICDGNEAWVFEVYGGNIWVAARVPDDSIFVAANRARINFFVENDPDNYQYAPGIKEFAIENGLWYGQSDFIPCFTFAPYPYRPYSTRREWVAMMSLDPTLNLDPEEKDTDRNWPCFVKPQNKVTVQDIFNIYGNYYQGTEYDVTKSIWGGQFGDPLNPAQDFTQRAINSYRCTYLQIAQVNASLPEEARCLVWFGWGAPSVTYLTPLFGSQTSLPEHFGRGVRADYDRESGWWNEAVVQQLSRINYTAAIEDVKAARDGKMTVQFAQTAAIQEVAASLIGMGKTEEAVAMLTNYSNMQSKMWFNTYEELADTLLSNYMQGSVKGNTWGLKYTDFWNELSASEWGQYK